MITCDKDYREYLEADERAFEISTKGLRNKILFYLKLRMYGERYVLLNYLKTLRRLEYLNNCKKKGFRKIYYIVVYWKWRKLCTKLQILIPVNTLGKGVRIWHLGPIVINSNVRIGENCMLQPGTLVGQKGDENNVPSIGDNVYFGPGCKVIGKITIGNDVVIAPNSVVVKDVAEGCIVSGIPAVVIKSKFN